MNALEIQGLSKTYSNGVKALKNINLEINEGDFFALLGVNGAGKTTIIGIITDLVNKTSGSVKVFGEDIDTDQDLVKQYIGVVPQEFNFSIFEKVIDIVVWQAGYYGIPRDVAIPRAKEILKKLGLEEKMHLVARTLSGGMKRRLMIARALIHQPKFLILDEPTAGVDVNLRIGMWEYLKDLNKNEGITILLTTHYLEEVEQLCENAAILKEGEIVKKDSVKNLINSLSKETYVIDYSGDAKSLEKSDHAVKIIEDGVLEIEVEKDQSITEIVHLLDSFKINVEDIKPKGNRLEELFLNIINEK